MYKVCLIVGAEASPEDELEFRGLIGFTAETETREKRISLYWYGPESRSRTGVWVGKTVLTWGKSKQIDFGDIGQAMASEAEMKTTWKMNIPEEQRIYAISPSLHLAGMPHIPLLAYDFIIPEQLDFACVAFYNSF